MARNPKTPKGILKRALRLIEDRKHWARGSMAVDARGRYVSEVSPDAVKFCSVGAVAHAAGGWGSSPAYNDAVKALQQAIAEAQGLPPTSTVSIVNANDTLVKNGGLGHKGVVKAFKRAIELAPGR